MVVGKHTTSAAKRAAAVPKLPPLQKLSVKHPNASSSNQCMAVMGSVLGCWASHGYNTQGCAVLEQSLRECMDSRKQADEKKNNINTHLSRLYPQMKGPHKRK